MLRSRIFFGRLRIQPIEILSAQGSTLGSTNLWRAVKRKKIILKRGIKEEGLRIDIGQRNKVPYRKRLITKYNFLDGKQRKWRKKQVMTGQKCKKPFYLALLSKKEKKWKRMRKERHLLAYLIILCGEAGCSLCELGQLWRDVHILPVEENQHFPPKKIEKGCFTTQNIPSKKNLIWKYS